MGHYLVAGAAGFIGSRVAELLVRDGNSVLGVDNLTSQDARLAEHRLDRLRSLSGFVFQFCDIADRDRTADVFAQSERIDGVINLAARAGVRQSVVDPWAYIAANVTGALNLLDLCRSHGVNKYVIASTSSAYGKSDRLPYQEDSDTSRPISPYAASKKSAELLAHTYHALHGLDITVLRYFTVYGPAGRPDMAPFRFIQRIREGSPLHVYGDGTQSRDFTYVDDIARGTIAALRPLGYEIINLGGDDPRPLNELIELIENRFGRRSLIEYSDMHAADVRATWANIDKAERLLQWRPITSLEDGIDLSATWYEQERSWAKDIVTE